jgi:hypothetical protein
LFVSVKKVFVSPNAQQMAGKDWRVLISRAADLYGMTLRLYHLVNTEETMISGSGRVRLMTVSENAYKLLRDVVVSNPGETISFCNLYDVIDEASKLFGYQHDLDSLRKTNFKDYPAHLKVYLQNNTTADDEDYTWYFKYGDLRIYRGTIKKFLLPVVQKYLRPVTEQGTLAQLDHPLTDYLSACKAVDSVDYNATGLRPENLDRLWSVVTRVSEGQLFLEKTFQYAHDNFGGTGDALSTETLPASLLAWLPGDPSVLPVNTFTRSLEQYLYQVPQGTLSTDTKYSAQFLSQIIRTHLPFFRDNDPRINFDNLSLAQSGEMANWRQSFVGLSALNAVRNIVHVTWDAYVTDPARVEGQGGLTAGISQDELRQFYMDVRELGIAFKLFDPTSMTAADSRFLEGNLFTYASNGDRYLSLAEGTDLVSFMFSSKGLSSKMYNLVHDQCAKWTVGCAGNQPGCHIGGKDVFGVDTISTECFNHFAMGALYQQLWDHMPNLIKFYSALPELGDNKPQEDRVYRETFSCMVETVARSKGANPKWIGISDTDQIAALEHYLEAMFVRFDANHSGTLNRQETLTAYPVLKNVIYDEVKKRVSFLNSDDDLQAVLTYILAQGTIPSTDDWGSLAHFGLWRYIHESKFEADRARIVQVMAAITGANVSGCFQNPNVLPDARARLAPSTSTRRR